MSDKQRSPRKPLTAPIERFEKSYLILENGAVFPGVSPVWQTENCVGEAVFTTGMAGYPESLTDPSFTGQILTFTYPLIGNYGVPNEDEWESPKIHLNGIVVCNACSEVTHHKAARPFLEWLQGKQKPILIGVDTRALTKVLRSRGTMLAAISKNLNFNLKDYRDPNKLHLVSQAALKEERTYGSGKKTVLAIDCGMKENIIRCLSDFPITIKRVPYDYDFSRTDYDGIFLSNGPGDPKQCVETIPCLTKALKGKKPIFGICLGAQLLALAAGGKTYKLPFGHRGQNVPCQDVETKKCYITSQNHGFAIDEHSLPKDWRVTFRNLNDGSVEGIAHKTKPFFAVQYHPEASPGPTDTNFLFETFYKAL